MMNPGGIRANLTYASSGPADPDGNVTFREAATVQPFANTLVTLNLTGAQVKAVLEEQWQPEGASRPFLKLGLSEGLQYTYDPTAAAGERITSVTLDGTPIDPEASYVVAANSFLASGGDNFFTFAEGANMADTGKVDLQSTVDWFAANGTASPDLAQRAVGVALSAPDADGYSAGDEVTIDLSSLAFSGGEAAPGAATVSLGDTELASGAVDPTIVDTTDEAGRASLTFTVPEGVYGEQQLTVTVADSGTSVQVPITFAAEGEGEFTGTIEVQRNTVSAGTELSVTGVDFEPGETVTVTLESKRGNLVDLGTVVVDEDGSFAASPTVPKNTDAGRYTVIVAQADGDQATDHVTVNKGRGGAGGIVTAILDWLWDLGTGWF